MHSLHPPVEFGILNTLTDGRGWVQVYSDQLKNITGFTQDEIQTVASTGNIGLYFAVVAGLVFDKVVRLPCPCHITRDRRVDVCRRSCSCWHLRWAQLTTLPLPLTWIILSYLAGARHDVGHRRGPFDGRIPGDVGWCQRVYSRQR